MNNLFYWRPTPAWTLPPQPRVNDLLRIKYACMVMDSAPKWRGITSGILDVGPPWYNKHRHAHLKRKIKKLKLKAAALIKRLEREYQRELTVEQKETICKYTNQAVVLVNQISRSNGWQRQWARQRAKNAKR